MVSNFIAECIESYRRKPRVVVVAFVAGGTRKGACWTLVHSTCQPSI